MNSSIFGANIEIKLKRQIMNKFISFFFAAMLIVSCDKQINVSAVILSQNTAELIEGKSLQLTALVQPSDATILSITWSSADHSVATVSDTGLVTAIAEGTTSIIAEAGGKTAVCIVKVKPSGISSQNGDIEKFGNENNQW